ncbi:alpha-ketoglutarate-dependent sulfonate dioxygenase [Fomitopsis serialis]|uniref:alpha-ketoglutarate-dependent sulfonate dioxygenase n=1 Tax=Fomitopsis serialis TaxID=139415 RepID=UPI002007B924|nr:alpha-ketoglutarate-dependent sulfonate dioxygenase [Neoantrodia serialis]KAH9919111.1 alpha-ketoglutarate-dependent sulfonate dioxygenase [Neoantrodia serialis]
MSTTVETITAPIAALRVAAKPAENNEQSKSEEGTHYPPLTPFDHIDPGSRALSHPNPRSFLDHATSITQLTPHLGEEVRGVSLAALDSDGRDQLALEVARRGLVVFRDQRDFINSGPDSYLEFGRHFGRLHIHPTSGHPENYPELHLVYRDANTTYNFEREDRITWTAWHSDVSYERQPPGLTALFLLSQPDTGGDTAFTSQAVHSGVEQANYSRSGYRGGVVRREPVENIHPLVRRHPVTGEEAIYVNKQFTRRIVGLKREESDAILELLYDHIAKSTDIQARVKWEPYTVVLWDNRLTAHSAIVDFVTGGQRRHGVRITPQAERPIPALEGLDLSA